MDLELPDVIETWGDNMYRTEAHCVRVVSPSCLDLTPHPELQHTNTTSTRQNNVNLIDGLLSAAPCQWVKKFAQQSLTFAPCGGAIDCGRDPCSWAAKFGTFTKPNVPVLLQTRCSNWAL